MRHFPIVLCVSALTCGYATLASAGTPGSLAFTLDLVGPCTQGSCTGTHPTDIDLTLTGSSFSYAPGPGGAFVTTLAVDAPVVCDEISSAGLIGPATSQQMATAFTNSAQSGGGLLEFNAGGPSVVDTSAFSYDGATPPGVSASYANAGGTTPQVICYRINPVSGGPIALAAGPSGIFKGSFEAIDGHFADEPWLSVQTVVSPSVAAGKAQASAAQTANSQITGITSPDAMGYVVQVHNAAAAIGWHIDIGYDYAFFDKAVNKRQVAPLWCVLGAGIPQPGAVNGTAASCGTAGNTHVLSAADIQAGTGSIYIYVENGGSDAAIANWATLGSGFYPAIAAIFPPYGTYPERFDDKVAVASANNAPTFNIGSIVCNNDTASSSCVLRDQDGNPVPNALKFQNSISSGGAATIDPLVYLVDPSSDSTLPGNQAQDGIGVSGVSCIDPQGILGGGVSGANFSTSPSAQGGKAFNVNFTPSGSPDFPFVSGTATCTATFSSPGRLPSLSTTRSFTITMQQAAVGSVAVVPARTQTAAPGGTVAYTLTVANAGSAALSNVAVSNPLAANVQSLSWTCTPAGGATCPAASGNAAISHTVPSLPVGGSLNYAITATLVGAASFASATQVSDAASISVPGGSCAGGNCSSSASIPTVPLIHLTLGQSPSTYANSGDGVTYTITLANEGGTDASGLTLANPGVAGLTFGNWTCASTGAASACPNASGSGAINESAIAIGAGGNVTYTLPGTVTVSSGNITDTVTVGPGGTVCVGNVCTAQQTLTGP